MKLVVPVVAVSALLLFGAKAQALDAHRLAEMKGAAARLKQPTEVAGEVGRPPLELVAILCRPGEAETLRKLPSDEYEKVNQYGLHIAEVLDVYIDAADRASQQTIVDYMRDLGVCFDAATWVSLGSLELMGKKIASAPDVARDPRGKEAIIAIGRTVAAELKGNLDIFAMTGIGPDWCEARLRPILALTAAVSKTISRSDKKALRAAVRTAERCGPVAKKGLQAAHRSLAK